MKKLCTLSLFILLFSSCWAQSPKRSLNQEDYDSWKSVQKTIISTNGIWVAYEVNPQEGDGELIVEEPNSQQKIRIPRGYNSRFSADNRYLIAKIKPQNEKVRSAKKLKLKSDRMPKDSLIIISLMDGSKRTYADVISYNVPEDAGNWIAFLSKVTETRDTIQKTVKPKKNIRQPKGDLLSFINMAGKDSVGFSNVTEYTLSNQGNRVVFVRESLKDTTLLLGVYSYSVQNRQTEELDVSSDYKIITNLVLDKKGNQAAWMRSADSLKAEVKRFSLMLRPFSAQKNVLVADTASTKLPQFYTPIHFRKALFSEDGNRLYFGIAPMALPSQKDTTLLDEELSRVDVWTWQDSKLQPMQDKQKKQDSERSFLTVFDIPTNKLIPLGSESLPQVEVLLKINQPFLLGKSNLTYQKMSSWAPGYSDFYLINAQTGSATPFAMNVSGNAELSPAGKYAFWFDEKDTLWKVYDHKLASIKSLTDGMKVAFYDEEHDTPDFPTSYGFAGWTKDDQYFLVYDRYDIWRFDPTMKEKPLNVTKEYGRTNRVVLRYLKMVEDEQFLDLSKNNLLWGQWEANKESGVLNWITSSEPSVIVKEAFYYLPNSFEKAKNADRFIFQKGNFSHPNDLYYVSNWSKPIKLTTLETQTEGIKWGTAELVSWLSNQGVKLEGLLFKPEGFDSTKKYPLLVYYYERNASTLNSFRAPAPSRSTINIPYCVSNDYLVFVPDIVYGGGTPGKNAYDCIVSGVLDLINKGYVDKDRIGIQGQSWGGYQTAYLITQTNMFRAAMAGAIVANMTSAYGGIRWGTGMSRMFQYEKTQSRVGGTLWEKPLYYIENSPLFYADRVQTPLMMMHNDADGSVPWYQGIEFFTALRRLNKPVWLLVYNDEDHNLTRRPNMKDLSIRMYQFFDHYLKDTPMPPWMKEGRSLIEKERWNMKYE